MAFQTPACNDSQWELLFKILQSLPSISTGGGTTSTLQSGQQAIANGADTVSVVFPTVFAAVPDVTVTISRPSGEALIPVNINQDSLTVTGFTAELGGTTPSGNYFIHWFAN